MYLERQLGDVALLSAHKLLTAASEDADDEQIQQQLAGILAEGTGAISRGEGDFDDPVHLIPLMNRLVVCEEQQFVGGEQGPW